MAPLVILCLSLSAIFLPALSIIFWLGEKTAVWDQKQKAKTLFKFPSRISEFKAKISEIKRSLKITMTVTRERWAFIFPVCQCWALGLPCVSQLHHLEELPGFVPVFLSFFSLSLQEKYNSGMKSIIMFCTSPSETLQERELSWLEG